MDTHRSSALRQDPFPPVYGAFGSSEATFTPRGLRTRGKLIEAAREILEEVGYPDATVTLITQRSGVSLGTFYRYFENKEQLFLLLLRSLVLTLYEAVSGTWRPDDVLGSLRESSRRYLTAYNDNRKLIAAMRDMASSVPDGAALWWELRLHTYKRMEHYLTSVVTGRGLDPAMTVSALGGMVEQFAYYWFVEAERYGREPPDIDEAADTLGRIWYETLYAR